MFKAEKRTRGDGTTVICIEAKLPAPNSEVILPDGDVLLRNYLTAEQWNVFCRADGSDIEVTKS
jgi:hypothetical protein